MGSLRSSLSWSFFPGDQCPDDVSAQIACGLEKGGDPVAADAVLEGLESDAGLAMLDILASDGMIVVDEEDQARLFQLNRPVVFHLADRNGRPLGHIAIAIGENADVDIGVLDHLQRHLDCIGVECRQVFHHLAGRKRGAMAAKTHLIPMLGQIPDCA